MKKLTKLFIVLVLAFIVFIGISCKKNGSSLRENPTLTDGDAVYLSVSEGSYTYTITKQELYAHLKQERGASSLIFLVDGYLLSQEKNSEGKTYLELATVDEVKKFIDKEVYGDEDLTDEEKAEKEEAFLASYKNNFDCLETSIYGDSIINRYKLTVAQKLYAKDVLKKEYDEHMAKYEDESNTDVTSPYFTDTQYANLYNGKDENKSTFSAIIVPFTTLKAAEAAKASVGELNSKDAYIALYQTVYGYKYTGEDDFALNTDDINSTVLAKLEALEDGAGTSTPIAVNDGQLFVYVYRISGNVKTKFADLDDAAKDAVKAKDSAYTAELLENALTSTYISKAIVTLRSDKNLAIYDDILEYSYADAISNYGTYEENTEVKSCVASVDGKEFTTEELFEQMLTDAKYKNIVEILSNKRLVTNAKYNSFLTESGTLTDAKKEELENKLEEEKKNFEDGTYTTYGYDPEKVTWRSFLEGTYGVSTDEEYMNIILVDDIIAAYKGKMNPLEQYTKTTTGEETTYDFEADETHPYWTLINAKMQENADNYLNITGIHVLVSLYSDVFSYVGGGTQVDPTVDGNWTEAQVNGAKELLTKISEYLKEEKGTYAEKLTKVIAAYKSAPSVAGTALSTFTYGEAKTIDLYTYKALGLTIIYQNLGTFSNGSMVESFNDSCKVIYDHLQQNANDKLAELTAENSVTVDGIEYSLKKEDVFANGIATKYGYHLFVETAVKEQTNLEEDNEKPARYIPTLDEIQKNASGQTVGSSIKTAISTYYTKYNTELTSSYFFTVVQNNEIKSLVSDENLKKYIDNYNDSVFENDLDYITKDFLN